MTGTSADTPMTDKDFQIACSALDDWRRVIAAGKIQRWEVLKWGVALNLALTTLSISIKVSGWWLIVVTALIAFASRFLIFHYNDRVVGARQSATAIIALL